MQQNLGCVSPFSTLEYRQQCLCGSNNYPPTSVICGDIDGVSFGSDILSKIYAGMVAFNGNATCTTVYETTDDSWSWQVMTFTSIVKTKFHIR